MKVSPDVHRSLRKALTVAELIETLQSFPEDARVVFGCDYGDYHHTEQALPVESADEIEGTFEILTESAYSHSHVSITQIDTGDEDVDTEDPDADEMKVVVLR